MTKRLWQIIMLTLTVVWGPVLMAKNYTKLHFAFEDGLPSNTIYHVYRDTRGFIWIATDKGIARYNGIRFDVFTSYDGLPDDEIYFFKEDYFGRLWIATANGKLCFYKDGVFYSEKNAPYLKLPFDKPHTTYIEVEYDSSVTIHYYDPAIFINLTRENKLLPFNMHKLDSAVYHNIGEFYKRKTGPDKYIVFGKIADCFVDTNGNVSFLRKRKYDVSLRFAFSQDQVYIFNDSFLFDRDGRMIRRLDRNLTTKAHLYNIYHDGRRSFSCTNKGLYIEDTVSVISNDDVSSITQDISGNYWVGTINNGLYCMRRNFQDMRTFADAYTGKIFYCRKLGAHLFFTTSDNNLYSFSNDSFRTVFDYRKYLARDFVVANDAVCLVDKYYRYYNFYEDQAYIIDDVLSARVRVHRYFSPFSEFGLKNIVRTASGLYLRSRNNIVNVDFSGVREGDSVHFKELGQFAKLDRTYCMAKDEKNIAWYSTLDAMYRIEDGQIKKQLQLHNFSLRSFEFLGRYLVGETFDNRLLLISDFENSPKADTIFSENCVWNKLYKVNDTLLLITTNNHDRLFTLNNTNSAKKFNVKIISDPFIPLNIEAFCADDTTCYFFKNGSLTCVPVKSLLEKSELPKLFFLSMKTPGKVYHITDGEVLEIPYAEARSLSVSFIAMSFYGRDVTYQYAMSKNGQDAWRPVKGEELALVNPGYGYYTLKVKARTPGNEYGMPAIFNLHILKPYWATWWFIVLCTCLVLAAVGVGIRLRVLYLIRRKNKEHATEVKFMKSEFKALNALMNPHFIFNTLNNVQSLFNENNKLAANEYLRVFADLIRQNMQNVSKELITLQKEMALVMNYLMLEKLRFEDMLNYEFNVDEEIDLSQVMVPPLLIQPLVENSIKHGILPLKAPGTIQINIYTKQDVLYIEIRDSGEECRRQAAISLPTSPLAWKTSGKEFSILVLSRIRISHCFLGRSKMIQASISGLS